MKILFFIQDLEIGGTGRQLSLLADGLYRSGHNVSVVALHAPNRNSNWRWDLDRIQIQSLLSEKSKFTIFTFFQFIQAPFKLRALLYKEDVQLIYSINGNVCRLIAWLATRGLSNSKLIWGVRGSRTHISENYRNWTSSLFLNLCKCVSGSVPLMISNSEEGYFIAKK